MRYTQKIIGLALLLLLPCLSSQAATLSIATASNFSDTLRQLAPLFSQTTGHKLRISAASTGKLYAQISHGAPYDLFLSADEARPALLEHEGLIVPGSRITYAVGQLALWAPQAATERSIRGRLEKGEFKRLAIANPKTAPYGKAAMETLTEIGLWASLGNAAARGENIGQAFQFVATGNADIGFVALSQLRQAKTDQTQYWAVPGHFHQPIRQQAVILARSLEKEAARDFIKFLGSDSANAIIQESGYQAGVRSQ